MWILPLSLVLVTGGASAQPLPSCYANMDSITRFVYALEDTFPQWVHVDSIGHSRGEMLNQVYPIYAVLISDNPTQFEDEPVFLVIGHIHGEELLGMQMTLQFMYDLVHEFGRYRNLINSTQLYFIPTMNPDGLEVVARGLDRTWRKNGYHPPELGSDTCRVQPGVGGDSCGVDLNRNFDINWIHGDTLWRPASNERYDYYRGPGAASEPETQAVCDFAQRVKPTLSVVYHMSRSGRVTEQCIAPWQWGADPGPYKFPPDCTMIGRLDRSYASLLTKEQGGAYTAAWDGQHKGSTEDWFYWQLGTIQFVTELGPPINIQPPCDTLDYWVQRHFPSLVWLAKRPVNLELGGPTPLTIHTRDSLSQQPISAQWKYLNTWTAAVGAWYTNEQHGSATFFPDIGAARIAAFKEGYRPDTVTTTVNPNSTPQSVTLDLAPLPWYSLRLRVHDASGTVIAGQVFLDYDYPKYVSVAAGQGSTINLTPGHYQARIEADEPGHMVLWREFDLSGDAELDFWLPASQSVWSEDFEGGLGSWTTGGTESYWQLDYDTTAMGLGNSLFTGTMPASPWPPVYANNTDSWIQYNQTLNVPASANVAYLEFLRRGRLDTPGDTVFVEVSTDGITWERAAALSDRELPWTRSFADLSRWRPSDLRLRFRLQSDEALGELGLHLDNLRLYGGTDTAAPNRPPLTPYRYRICGAYPNPFNPSTTISYEVAGPSSVRLAVFNLLGQEVRSFDLNLGQAGRYTQMWDGTSQTGCALGSGLYFVQLEASGARAAHKLLLLR